MNWRKRQRALLLVGLLSLIFYYFIGYQIQRGQFVTFIALCSILFLAYGFLLIKRSELSWKPLFIIGLAFHLIFLFSVPALSDDFYRFVWDGQLLIEGSNPYLSLPSEVGAQDNFKAALLEGMNSPEYFSVYPPFLQYLFGTSLLMAPKSIMAALISMRLIIIGASIACFFLMRKLLRLMDKHPDNAFIYFLNPLLIIEMSGNLHFEAVVAMFLVMSMIALFRNRLLLSALTWTLAVLTKLIPLIFLPLYLLKLKWKRSIAFIAIAMLLAFLISIPMIDLTTIEHFGQSLDLYFRKFEFNASIYYLMRSFGISYLNYNPIQTLGPILGLIALIGILAVYGFGKVSQPNSFVRKMLFALTFYYLFALVVHPWYISLILLLGCMQTYFYPILWSFLALLSYSAYRAEPVVESQWILWMEYFLLYGLILFELFPIGISEPFDRLKAKVFLSSISKSR